MTERKCIFDPLVELMAHYADKKTTRVEIDPTTLTVEERLKQRIIDGDQIGIDSDLAEALKSHEPLDIINTILLDGMKVVGVLFGSGQMQLPFVLQSAETMKRAVAWLEPYMEQAEGSTKGTIVLATVKGDVHDIGKNLVDIILTNNGYRVINLGIKMPIDTMLDAATTHSSDAIGMSGLLVKSTLVMKENLDIMRGRGIDIPVILGGAALTRRYVEENLREIYGRNVAYASDAFAGLYYMERIMAGDPEWGGGNVAQTAEAPQNGSAAGNTATAQEHQPGERRAAVERGEVRIRVALDDELDVLAELMGVMPADLRNTDIEELIVAELHEAVIGGGRVRLVSEGVYELTNIAMIPEQWAGGVGMDLVRTMRRHARRSLPDAIVFVTCDPDDMELGKFYRTIGFETVDVDDLRASVASDKIGYCIETYGRPPALYIARQASVLGETLPGSSLEVAQHLMKEQVGNADQAIAAERYQTDAGVTRLRITSDVDRTLPVPHAPFFGSRIVENIRLEKVFEYVNEVALIRGQWQVRKGGRSSEEYRRELDEVIQPKLAELKLRTLRESILEPKVIYGYFPCRADYNTLVVYRPRGIAGDALVDEWKNFVPTEENVEEWQRFEFPRQSHGRHLCISDFYRSVDSPEFDVVAFQIVTMGKRASEYTADLFARNNYVDYLYLHGLSVESAEALAEYWHRSVRIELGIADKDAGDIRRLFAQGYRGSRYSFGYPACPNIEDQAPLFEMLRPERIGVNLSDEFMLDPEQSTSAIVVHHPEAKYFNVRE